jgi:hypothetical protein
MIVTVIVIETMIPAARRAVSGLPSRTLKARG